MGANMVRRLLGSGHTCVGYARRAEVVEGLVAEGMVGSDSLEDLVSRLARPRAVWLMVPAAVVDATLEQLVPLLDEGDIVIDGATPGIATTCVAQPRWPSRVSTTWTWVRAAGSGVSSAASA
jgi:6-phosphogluconate dehydrogenase (decarboxylating)